MTVRCSCPTMAPIWIWSPLWLSKGTSWRAFNRTTQGEADSHLYPFETVRMNHSLSSLSKRLCPFETNWWVPLPPSLSLSLTHIHRHTHTHTYNFLSSTILIKWEESQAAGYGFLGSTSSRKVWSALESGTDVPSPPQLQLVSRCVFTIIHILIYFVTKFHSSQNCQLAKKQHDHFITVVKYFHSLKSLCHSTTERENGNYRARYFPQKDTVSHLDPDTPCVINLVFV